MAESRSNEVRWQNRPCDRWAFRHRGRPSPAVWPPKARASSPPQRGADAEFEGIEADFTNPASPSAVVAEIIARAGRLDVLVNNAGMMQESPGRGYEP